MPVSSSNPISKRFTPPAVIPKPAFAIIGVPLRYKMPTLFVKSRTITTWFHPLDPRSTATFVSIPEKLTLRFFVPETSI